VEKTPGIFSLFLHVEHFEHFVAVVVNDFDGDLAGVGFREGTALGAVDAGPSRFVNF
jgi:hypothetical protein